MDTMVDSTGSLPAAFTEYRHLPPQQRKPSRRSKHNLIRAAAKDLGRKLQHETEANRSAVFSHIYGTPGGYTASEEIAPHALRPKLEAGLASLVNNDELCWHLRCYRMPRKGRPSTASRLDAEDVNEERDLAMSDVPLPCDNRRRPSLEREEAFWDGTTTKSKVRVQRPMPLSEDSQIAELYQQGILYDAGERESQKRAEPFTLNAIRHDEPLYTVRPPRRAGRKAARSGRHAQSQTAASAGKHLDLDLSFADLGADDEIARYLAASSSSSSSFPSLTPRSSTNGAVQHPSRESSARVSAPLRVVYELSGTSPTFDVDTSQPPELVIDSLSDYDYFSDSDLEDDSTPSQKEVQGTSGNPQGETWVMLGNGS